MESWKWGRLGATASLAVMLSEVGKQLSAIETANARAYGTSTFTAPKVRFWDTNTLNGAMTFWRDADNAPAAQTLLSWHVRLDLVFLCLVASLAAQLLTALGVQTSRRRAAVFTYLAVDFAETLLMLDVVDGGHSTGELVGLQLLTLVKWFALADVTLLAITSPAVKSGFSFSVFKDAPNVPTRAALIGQWSLVAIFAAFIALPGGGPLEQLPDILRQQLADPLGGTFLGGTLCVIGLTAAIIVSGAIGLRAATAGSPTPRSSSVLVVGVAVTAVLAVIQVALEEWTPVTLAPIIVLGVVQVVAWWRELFAPAATTPSSEDAAATAPSASADTRLGALGGAVAMLAGLGLVRATAPYLVLDLEGARWRIFCALGVVAAVASVGVARWLLARVASTLNATVRLTIMIATPALVGVAAGGLALVPGEAWRIGANGVLAVWLALASMVVAGFQLLSRKVAVWTATQSLGFGQRTPWGLFAVAVYIVASTVNTAGGYHDVRVENAEASSGGLQARYAYSSVDEAVEQWMVARDAACGDDAWPVPLVLVAAPGGGIRAALWTAAGLDKMFPTKCARTSLFAISGASGGSVGATVWQAASNADTSATAAVTAMSGPEPLAAGLAGMLMRDLPQPITGLTRQWNDRAALIEDEWVDASGVLGTISDPLLWSELRSEGWTPVLVLNSSSVTDGCRVVISNTAHLPTALSQGCMSRAQAGGGPISGAVDPLATLRDIDGDDYGTCSSGQLSAVSATMLSARFPYVTPSGAMHICPTDAEAGSHPGSTHVEVYGVDGGYIENSGILATIELVDEIQAGPYGRRVEPWIVVLDNHYRSEALPPTPNRPKEFVVPLEALRNKPNLSQVVLEQMAAEQLWNTAMACPRLIRVGPAVRPDLAAPLGWTLSTDTVNRLLDSMDSSLKSLSQVPDDTSSGVEADACSSKLLTFLQTPPPGNADSD